MNWLTDFVRPKIQALWDRSESKIPDDLWVKCPSCEQMIFHRELQDNLRVCPHCSYHMRLPVLERLNLLFDRHEYQQIAVAEVKDDPLSFKDSKRYVDRLKEYRSKTGQKDAMIVATGCIENHPAVVAAMNFDFMGGSMGVYVGSAFVTAVNAALERQVPLIAITASGGARMQEGMLSLMQMPVTVMALERLSEARLPYIVILTDPTMGGVSASFAMLGDIAIAEPGALIGFAGPRVIEETLKQKLPEGFQRAEFLRSHGMVDMVVPRKELKTKLGRILSYFAPREKSCSAKPKTQRHTKKEITTQEEQP